MRNWALNNDRDSNKVEFEDETDNKAQARGNHFIKPLQQKEINDRQQAISERRPAAEQRAERKQKDEVRDMLFNHFKTKHCWSTKELKEATNQPENYLKDILKEIASFQSTGDNRGKWMINEEYRG